VNDMQAVIQGNWPAQQKAREAEGDAVRPFYQKVDLTTLLWGVVIAVELIIMLGYMVGS